jgi:hypothetical protein
MPPRQFRRSWAGSGPSANVRVMTWRVCWNANQRSRRWSARHDSAYSASWRWAQPSDDCLPPPPTCTTDCGPISWRDRAPRRPLDERANIIVCEAAQGLNADRRRKQLISLALSGLDLALVHIWSAADRRVDRQIIDRGIGGDETGSETTEGHVRSVRRSGGGSTPLRTRTAPISSPHRAYRRRVNGRLTR